LIASGLDPEEGEDMVDWDGNVNPLEMLFPLEEELRNVLSFGSLRDGAETYIIVG